MVIPGWGRTMRKRKASKPAGRRRAGVRVSRPSKGAAKSRYGSTDAAMAALAHEVRTPLTGLLAFAELLATSTLLERERAWVDAIKSAAEHISQFTTLVVDGARAGRGKFVAQHVPFHLRRLAETVAAGLRARADAKGLAAEVAIADDVPAMAVGDAVRLRAMLENLIDNAVKFTEHGRVAFALDVRRAGRGRLGLRFRVSDDGIGLSPAEIARLFRPFTQANASVARRYRGAGLGLAFVRRIAKAMGGTLAVESAPGRGSTFILSVTLTRASPDVGASAAADAARPHPAAGLRILCVEDNPYGRVIMNTMLAELGHRADFVGSGEAAVEAVRNAAYGLVLMDVALPDMSGLEATRRIRALSRARARVPVIGISGRTAPEDEAAAKQAGMNAYLAKPVSPSALASALASVKK